MNTEKLLMGVLVCFSGGLAQSAECEQWRDKLQSAISVANQCEPKYQACLAKEFGNPMRELDYCKKVLNRCESLDARPESGSLPKEVEAFKKQCES